MTDQTADTIHVTIFGEEYALRNRDDADVGYMNRVAEHVDRSMRDIAERAPDLSTIKVAILAALNVTDELYSERRDSEQQLADMHSRARGILTWLDERLESGSPAKS